MEPLRLKSSLRKPSAVVKRPQRRIALDIRQLIRPKKMTFVTSEKTRYQGDFDAKKVKADIHLRADLVASAGDMITIVSKQRLQQAEPDPYPIMDDETTTVGSMDKNFKELVSIGRPVRDESLRGPLLKRIEATRRYKMGLSPFAKLKLFCEIVGNSTTNDSHMVAENPTGAFSPPSITAKPTASGSSSRSGSPPGIAPPLSFNDDFDFPTTLSPPARARTAEAGKLFDIKNPPTRARTAETRIFGNKDAVMREGSVNISLYRLVTPKPSTAPAKASLGVGGKEAVAPKPHAGDAPWDACMRDRAKSQEKVNNSAAFSFSQEKYIVRTDNSAAAVIPLAEQPSARREEDPATVVLGSGGQVDEVDGTSRPVRRPCTAPVVTSQDRRTQMAHNEMSKRAQGEQHREHLAVRFPKLGNSSRMGVKSRLHYSNVPRGQLLGRSKSVLEMQHSKGDVVVRRARKEEPVPDIAGSSWGGSVSSPPKSRRASIQINVSQLTIDLPDFPAGFSDELLSPMSKAATPMPGQRSGKRVRSKSNALLIPMATETSAAETSPAPSANSTIATSPAATSPAASVTVPAEAEELAVTSVEQQLGDKQLGDAA
mmetsp:Transcript_8445/g.18546  ORF Transcript_8445/g.18546 Transcript_8445/m.18546 type:complete len:599 (+) Transcript_8445:326-2122(+)